MGRSRTLEEISELQITIKTFKDRLIENGNNVTSRFAAVWSDLRKCISFSMSELALFTAVSKNYYNLWTVLGIDKTEKNLANYTQSDSASESSSSCSIVESNSTDDADDSNLCLREKMKFSFYLTNQEYDSIRPEEVDYKCSDITEKGRNRTTRRYLVFPKGEWTHVLYRKFVEKTHLPCILNFKRAKFYRTGEHFCKIYGACKECCSTFLGIIDKEPLPDSNVEIKCHYVGLFRNRHKCLKKRFLSGTMRKRAVSALKDKNMSSSMFRKIQAKNNMAFGEQEPADLPSMNVLRVAKYEANQKEKLNKNPIIAAAKMGTMPDYNGIIRNIGYKPFFIFYWSNMQIHTYRKYCKDSFSILQVDATGGVVKKIKHPWGEKSSHIFLYDCVIRDSENKKQFSVGSMLSESNTGIMIQFWLASWLKSGAPVPSCVVTDMSRALVFACCNAFTECNTIFEYTENCYKVLFSNHTASRCYLRLDVAHIIKLMSRWACLKSKNKQISKLNRKFYLTSLAQLIQTRHVDDFFNVAKAIFTVALSETEGLSLVTGEDTICETRKKWLINRISTGTVENITASICSENFEEEVPTHSSIHLSSEDNLNGVKTSSFYKHLFEIYEECLEIARRSEEVGNRGNQQILPDIVQEILNIADMLPLWSSVMAPYYPEAPLIASSASVESNFNNIKNRDFSHRKLPLNVDVFLREHIDLITGSIIQAGTSFNKKEEASQSTLTADSYKDNVREIESIAKEIEIKSSKEEEAILSVQSNTISEDNINHINYNGPEDDVQEIEDDVSENTPSSLALQTKTNAENTELADTSLKEICSSCQLGLIEKDHCASCNFPVHNNTRCVIIKEDLIFCKLCAKEEAIVDGSFGENWRNLMRPPQKRPRTSYLQPNSEFLHADLTSKSTKVLPIGLLKNGHRIELKPVKLSDGRVVTLSNTCAFDSVAQLLTTAYSDSAEFNKMINKCKDDICKLVKLLIKSSLTSKCYRIRAEILSTVFQAKAISNNLHYLDCYTFVAHILTKVWSISHSSGCSLSTCGHCGNVTKKDLPFITVDSMSLVLLDPYILSLREEVQQKQKCTKRTNGRLCSGQLVIRTELNKTFFFLEPNNSSNLKLEITCSLESIQHVLSLNQNTYKLRGVIGFEEKGSGHFISYCRRHDGLWEQYNDLLDKKIPCSSKLIVTVLYILFSI